MFLQIQVSVSTLNKADICNFLGKSDTEQVMKILNFKYYGYEPWKSEN